MAMAAVNQLSSCRAGHHLLFQGRQALARLPTSVRSRRDSPVLLSADTGTGFTRWRHVRAGSGSPGRFRRGGGGFECFDLASLPGRPGRTVMAIYVRAQIAFWAYVVMFPVMPAGVMLGIRCAGKPGRR